MRKIPFLRLTIFLILGIICNQYIQIELNTIISIIAGLSFITAATYLLSKRMHLSILLFGSFVLGLFFCIGLFAAELSKKQYQKNHYAYNGPTQKEYLGKISNIKSGYKNNLTVKIHATRLIDSTTYLSEAGLIMVRTEQVDFQVGDIVSFITIPLEIHESKNAGAFNYRKYCSNRQIYYSSYCDDIVLRERNENVITSMQHVIKNSIEDQPISNTSKAVITAMLLGEKETLGELEDVFRKTGTSHVLAISGLHVGIITAILFFMLSFLPDRMMMLKHTILIIGVWFFCILSGMAPSTVRATIMVSCFLIGKTFRITGLGYNFCFMAAFFMLLKMPTLIYDIGFQFSFLAILGILFFYEPLYKSLIFKGLKDKLWQMSILSLSAQIMIIPLSLYYFHQFPVLFIVTSIVAIPATFLIVSTSILNIVIYQLGLPFEFMFIFVDWFIRFFVELLRIFASFPYLVIENLQPSVFEILSYYIAIAGVSAHYLFDRPKAIILCVLSVVAMIGFQFKVNGELAEHQVVVYAHEKDILIDIISAGNVLSLYEATMNDRSIEWLNSSQHVISHCTEKSKVEIPEYTNTTYSCNGYSWGVINSWKDGLNIDTLDLILINCQVPTSIEFPHHITAIDFGHNTNLASESIIRNEQLFIKL